MTVVCTSLTSTKRADAAAGDNHGSVTSTTVLPRPAATRALLMVSLS